LGQKRQAVPGQNWDLSALPPKADIRRGQLALLTLAILAMPLAAQAQGIVRGAQEGVQQGNRVAGPVGGAVGGAVGGVVGGVAGGVKGVLGVPQRTSVHYRHYRHRTVHRAS
jgi:hypothetical protein